MLKTSTGHILSATLATSLFFSPPARSNNSRARPQLPTLKSTAIASVLPPQSASALSPATSNPPELSLWCSQHVRCGALNMFDELGKSFKLSMTGSDY
ncbi:unnamed protein product [Urochloa humidicola]